ncbi:MAG: penicillin-binding protein 2 [bacterium]
MDAGETILLEVKRIRMVLLIMLGLLLLLAAMLFDLQVSRRPEFEASLHKQSVRRIRLPAPRGRIFDRNQVCLADNQPCYCLAFNLEDLRQPGRWKNTVTEVQRRIGELKGLMGRKAIITEEDIWTHIRRRLPLPLVAWRSLDPAALARLAESSVDMKGVDIYVEPNRVYPKGESAAHLLGYVGKTDFSAADMDGFQYYLPEMDGKMGLERQFNKMMLGEPGEQLVRIDASGLKRAERTDKVAAPGANLILAIDSRIQGLAEAAIRDVPGAVVVLDPSNGDVLALASSPSFNPNQLMPVFPKALWEQLNNDPAKPMLNKAVAEVYAPGSIFKPVTALAALNSESVSAATTVTCPGYFMVGNKAMKCWNPNGHGVVDLRRGIEQSCNTYFITIGLKCGNEAISDLAKLFGLGEKTGIELDREAAGIVPTPEWKQKYWHDDWRNGDTCNFSIGQGALAVTPLQMAVVAATLANGGDVFRPRLVLGLTDVAGNTLTNYPVTQVRHLPIAPETMQLVRRGMHDVVMAPTGTGKRASIPGIEMAGKTGTAEYGEKEDRKKHGWMILFAPYDKPRYAVAMVVDDAVSGGFTVGPRLHDLMMGIFKVSEGSGEGEG